MGSLLRKWKEKTPQQKMTVCRGTAFVLCGMCIVFWVLAFLLQFEPEIGYFRRDAVLPAVATVCMGIAALATVALYFLLKKTKLPETLPRNGSSVFFVSSFAAFMSLFEAGYRVVQEVRTSGFSDLVSAANRIVKMAAWVDLVTIVVSFGTAAALFLAANERDGKKRPLWGMFPAFRGVLGILQIYFDVSVGMNVPQKLLGEFGLMAAVLYFMAEDRFRVAPGYAKPAVYVATSVLGLCYCGAAGLSLMVFYFRYNDGFVQQEVQNIYGEICLQACFCLIVFLYILVRFLAYAGKAGLPADIPAEDAAAEEAETAAEIPAAEGNAEAPAQTDLSTPTSEEAEPGAQTTVAQGKEEDNEN